jgi:hypothetical protein
MKIAALLCASALALTSITPAFAQATMSEADCTAWMTKADKNADGSLSADEATPFLTAMTQANVQPTTAGTITKDEFMAQCAKGGFASVQQAQ